MNNITPIQALQNLYIASRKATLSADEHSICAESAKVLETLIKSATEAQETRKKAIEKAEGMMTKQFEGTPVETLTSK